jgi:bifunctional DNA-binding transcriptional regulator/antitoxin component of YhaV-PrlF toxin-antitoxin module
MTSYILEVQEDSITGELFIQFPDEVIEELGWEEGDILDWNLKGNGVILKKINDDAGYEVIEE